MQKALHRLSVENGVSDESSRADEFVARITAVTTSIRRRLDASMAKRDYYDILGLKKSASADEIKKAHRTLVRKFHPDVNKGSPAVTEKFKEIQEAYDVLSDPEKRQKYDEFGHAGPIPGGGDPWESMRRGAPGRGGRQSSGAGGATVEDFDFGDVFEQFFGGAGGSMGGQAGRARGRGAPPMPRGNDIEYPVTLSFEDAARGRTLPLQLRKGSKVESIEIKIPAGVKDGSRVRIKGKGDAGAGGHDGDLFIIVTVQPHPYFRRDGLDVVLDCPISLYEAVQGAKVTVPTLDGPVTLTIPPGTSSGAKLRIKSRGVERGGEKGDQHVLIKVVIPKDLDDEDRSAIDKMREKHPFDARADVPWQTGS